MNIQRTRDLVNNETLAVKVIAGELIDIALKHKKKAAIVIIFHLWLYSLAFKHIAELKSLLDLIPFIH